MKKKFYTKEQVIELLDDLKKELYRDIDFHSFNSNHSEERGIREAIARITNIIIHINTNNPQTTITNEERRNN